MFGYQTVLVDDEEPGAGLLLAEAVPLVDGVPDGEDDPTAGAARPGHHNPLVLQVFRRLALHLHGAVQPGQHGGGRALDVVIEHEVLVSISEEGGEDKTFEARRQRVLSENLQTGSKLEATEVLLQP